MAAYLQVFWSRRRRAGLFFEKIRNAGAGFNVTLDSRTHAVDDVTL
jgi:hypothetical protein